MAQEPTETEMPPKTAQEIILDAHEERIQRLEQGHAEVASQVAVLTQRVDAGFDRMSEKIDNALEPVAKKMSWHMEEDAKLTEKVISVIDQVKDNDERIAKIEEKAAKRKASLESFKKNFWVIIVAGAGVLAKELAVAAWHYLASGHH
jgi:chromosome segregation ATPase